MTGLSAGVGGSGIILLVECFEKGFSALSGGGGNTNSYTTTTDFSKKLHKQPPLFVRQHILRFVHRVEVVEVVW